MRLRLVSQTHVKAGADFSTSDAAALRNDLITYFQREPAKQIEGYESIAKLLPRPSVVTGKTTWLALALVRYNAWQAYAGNAQAFREFQSYPFGRMVIKYNPVLVNSGGMIVTQTDVDCQFYSNALVADVWREARQVENDAEYTARYYQLYRNEAVGAVLHANRVNTEIIGLATLRLKIRALSPWHPMTVDTRRYQSIRPRRARCS